MKLALALYVCGSVVALVACSKQTTQMAPPPPPPPAQPAPQPDELPQQTASADPAPPQTPTIAVTPTKKGKSVMLRWDATAGATNYSVYQAPMVVILGDDNCGVFRKVGVTSTPSYTDHNVTSGHRYCYAVTESDAGNVESPKSDVAIAVIP